MILKNKLLLTCIIIATSFVNHFGQAVGINTKSIPNNTILHVYSDPLHAGGILGPRLTTSERNTIPSTAGLDGLFLFNTTTGRYEVLHGGNWTGLDGGLWNPGANGSIYHNSGFVGIQTQHPQTPLQVTGDQPLLLTIHRNGANQQAQLLMKNDTKGIYFGIQPSGSFITAAVNNGRLMMEISPDEAGGELSVNGQAGGIVPKGGIIMWSGAVNNIPEGWALCDGKTVSGVTTPNLSGKFVVGYSPNHDDYNAPGKTGGQDRVSLTVNELPSHSHTYSGRTSQDGAHSHTTAIGTNCCSGDNGYYLWKGGFAGNKTYTSSTSGNHSHSYSGTTNSVGSNVPHENRPPYYVLAYIIKL